MTGTESTELSSIEVEEGSVLSDDLEIRPGGYLLANGREMTVESVLDGWRMSFYPALGVPGAWCGEAWTYEREELAEYLAIALLAASAGSPLQPPTIDEHEMVVRFL